MARVYNFSAGPSMLPESVLNKAAAEMLDYEGCGMSVMEMSHRSSTFQSILDDAEQTLRRQFEALPALQPEIRQSRESLTEIRRLDAQRRERQRHVARELANAALRDVVGGEIRNRHFGVDGRHVDDCARPAAFFRARNHFSRHGLANEKRAFQIDAQYAIEIGFLEFEEIR